MKYLDQQTALEAYRHLQEGRTAEFDKLAADHGMSPSQFKQEMATRLTVKR